MRTDIAGRVTGHIDLDQPEQFDITGKTYAYSPEYVLRVDRVRPGSNDRRPSIRLDGQRVLKSGELGTTRLSIDVEVDDSRVPVAVRAEIANLRHTLMTLRDYIEQATR